MSLLTWLHRNPLRAWRRRHAFSQPDAARELRLSRQTIYLWETGKRNPSTENWQSLTHLTGITPREWQAWKESYHGSTPTTDPTPA
jgi:DNA-binding XRE family transcriptional regulator